MRLPQPYSPPVFNPREFIINLQALNPNVEANVSLLAGDPLLEVQATAISTIHNYSSASGSYRAIRGIALHTDAKDHP